MFQLEPQIKQLEIIEVLESLVARAASFGIHFKGYTPKSLATFQSLPVEIKGALIEALRFSESILVPFRRTDLATNKDAHWLMYAAQKLQLKVPESFINLVEEGDVVEIYSIKDKLQIYRNLEFLNLCSYDLLTICVTPYPELFEREEGFEERIVARSEEVTHVANGAVSWAIEDHTIVERLESHNNKVRLKLGHISPVFSLETGERVAWVSRIRAEPLGSAYQHLSNVIPI